MNSKLIKASVAGVAAIAVAAGGTTFAAWSDFDTAEDIQAGAGQLTLNLDAGTSSVVGDRMKLAPGQGVVRDVYIASNDGDSVPDADLFVTIKNLTDTEDGCTSTNSEAAAQETEYPGTDCSDTSAPGQFSDQVKVGVTSTPPVSGGPASCTASGAYANSTPHTNTGSLNDNDEIQLLLAEDVPPGSGVCVRFVYLLQASATNSVQGDYSEFDLLFDLVQA